jgi:hypothetical protein
MWIFTIDGLISATRSREEPDKIQVRARSRQTIEAVAGLLSEKPTIIETGHSDYRYRLIITPADWVDLSGRLADEVTYENFKSEVADRFGHDDTYTRVLHKVWSAGMALDDGGKPKP